MSVTYAKPGFFTASVFNPIVKLLAGRLGVSLRGAQVLSVQGRKTGEWRSVPVNPLTWGPSAISLRRAARPSGCATSASAGRRD